MKAFSWSCREAIDFTCLSESLMGRFDGPYFQVEREDVVSVWAATCPAAEIPDDYFTEDYGEDENVPFTRFSADFGFGFYDHDFAEAHHADDGRPRPIAELLSSVSYGDSFRDQTADRAGELGVGRTAFVFLMFNFRYDPSVTGVRDSDYLRFVGVFPFCR